MAGVRLLVGTAKGAFVLTADEARTDWEVKGPLFSGWEVYGMQGSPLDPDLVYASPSTGWHGQVIQRSEDGGATWQPVDNDFTYQGEPGTHLWYDGTPRPFEFTRIWKVEPSLFERDVVYAGAQDAALYRSDDAGDSWTELSALRQHPSAPQWQPGAGGMCLHTILQHPDDADRMLLAISAAGCFSTADGGQSWTPANKGLVSGEIPDEESEVGHCVHKLALHPAAPETVFMQKHWDVMRSDDFGGSWREVSGDLPTDFGFVVDVHAHEPETVYVVPITSDTEHVPPDGRLRVYRNRGGSEHWEPLSDGLPQANYYHDVLRDCFAVDELDDCGLYVGTTGGDVWASPDGGESWLAAVRGLPRILSVEAQTL